MATQCLIFAIQPAPGDEPRAVEQINGEWPEGLPYFTMILGEIDPRVQRATIVQAGHPSPLLIRADGSVKSVGDGGFPVGEEDDEEGA